MTIIYTYKIDDIDRVNQDRVQCLSVLLLKTQKKKICSHRKTHTDKTDLTIFVFDYLFYSLFFSSFTSL